MASLSMVQMSLREYNELYDAKIKMNRIRAELYNLEKTNKDIKAYHDCINHLMNIVVDRGGILVPNK